MLGGVFTSTFCNTHEQLLLRYLSSVRGSDHALTAAIVLSCFAGKELKCDMQAEEAQAMARQMVDVYAEFAVNAAAMPVIAGALSYAPWLEESLYAHQCHVWCRQALTKLSSAAVPTQSLIELFLSDLTSHITCDMHGDLTNGQRHN